MDGVVAADIQKVVKSLMYLFGQQNGDVSVELFYQKGYCHHGSNAVFIAVPVSQYQDVAALKQRLNDPQDYSVFCGNARNVTFSHHPLSPAVTESPAAACFLGSVQCFIRHLYQVLIEGGPVGKGRYTDART